MIDHIRKQLVCFCATAMMIATAFAAGGDLDGDGVTDASDVCSNTPPGVFVDESGRPIGDYDGDCDVDLSDLEWFVANFTGPLVPADSEVCDDGLDNDRDDLIDCADDLDCPLGTLCSNNLHCSQFATCGCPDRTGDCDADPQNGCETDTDGDDQNCGQCNVLCTVANGTSTCEGGDCAVGGCDSGWCDVDGLYENGCEFNLNGNPACQPLLPYDGSVSGDSLNVPLIFNAQGERWFRVAITEDSSGVFSKDLTARIQLESAAGTNYDLYVRCVNCTGLENSSANGPGLMDTVFKGKDDVSGSDDGFDLLIEIRWQSGACGDYTITIEGDVITPDRSCNP